MTNTLEQLKTADFEKWKRRDLWTLVEFALLVKKKEPISGMEPIHDDEFLSFYKELERLTDDAERLEKLRPVNRELDEMVFISRKYRSHEILSWAAGIGIEIPQEFHSLLEKQGPAGKAEDNKVDVRERNTFLKIIAVLAKSAGVELDSPFKAAVVIQHMGDEYGVTLPSKPDTISNKLKEAKALIEEE
jgi:hypothetical protein